MQYKNKKSSIQEIISHQHFTHFLLYCLSYIVLGQIITCLGPMFPYLSAHQGRLETQYSFLFVCRAAGFIIGSVLMRVLMEKLTLHQFIGLGVGLMGSFSILFGFVQNLYMKGFFIFIASIGSSFQDVTINLAALECFKGENLSSWLQTIHGAFGIGGLLGPFIVYLFQLNSLTVLGILALITVIFYYLLQTPETMSKQVNTDQEEKVIHLPSTSIYLISIGFLFAVGQQISYGGWISSYAVLYNFSTKEHATFYSSLYWISITAFRFILAAVAGKPTTKVIMLAFVGIFTTFISYFLIFSVNTEFGLIIMSILYGLCNSVLFPLLLIIPEQFGYRLTIKESSTFIIWASLGEGCLAVTVGKMMEYFSYNWLLYSICLFNIAIVIVMKMNTKILTENKAEIQKSDNLQKLITNYQKSQKTGQSKTFEMKQMKEMKY